MQAIILAAGLGTRLRPYTLIRPKPLFPVLNRPLLHHLLDMVQQAGCERIVVNCYHLGEQIRESLNNYPHVHLQVEKNILGTGGSLRLAAERFSDAPILVINGDIFHTVDLDSLYRYHCQSTNAVTLAMHDYPRFNTVGIDGKKVVSFQPDSEMERLAFTGIHVVDPEVVSSIPWGEFFHIIDLYQQLAQEGKIGLLRVDGAFWRDIGTAEDYLQLHRELLEGGIRSGCGVVGRREGNWLLGQGVVLEKTTQLQGWGCLGNGVRVGKSVVLSQAVIWDHVSIPDNSSIVDAIITGD